MLHVYNFLTKSKYFGVSLNASLKDNDDTRRGVKPRCTVQQTSSEALLLSAQPQWKAPYMSIACHLWRKYTQT